MSSKLYVDMDRVLCNFLKGVVKATGLKVFTHEDWAKNREQAWKIIHDMKAEFWANLEWTADGRNLWYAVKHLSPRILSAYPKVKDLRPAAVVGKTLWIFNNLGAEYSWHAQFCAVEDKQLRAERGAILIDDNALTIKQWRSKGGIGILHTSTRATLEELKHHANLRI